MCKSELLHAYTAGKSFISGSRSVSSHKGITNQQQVIFDNVPDECGSNTVFNRAICVEKEAVMKYSFPYLTIQEYFAANHMSQQLAEEQVRMFQHHQNNIRNVL